jgi:hypothetical protein
MTETRTQEFDLAALLPGSHLCAECASRLCTGVSHLPGVLESGCDIEAALLRVEHDPALLASAELTASLERLAAEVTVGVEHAAYRVTGLD